MQRSVLHLKLKNSSRAPRYSKIQDGTQQEQIVLERTAKSKLETTPSAFGKSIQFVDRIIHILMEGCTDLLNRTGLYWPVLACTGLYWTDLGCTGCPKKKKKEMEEKEKLAELKMVSEVFGRFQKFQNLPMNLHLSPTPSVTPSFEK